MQSNHLNMWSYLLEDSRRLATVEVLRIEAVDGLTFRRLRRSVPPLPGELTYTVSDPAHLIQSALQGMTNLREVHWEDGDFMWRSEVDDLDLCDRTFWDLMPRICHEVQIVGMSLLSWNFAEGCRYCAVLCELHRLNGIRVFRGHSLHCKHERLGLETSTSRAIQSRLFAAFSRLEELCLTYSRILAFSDLRLPLLKDLRLFNVEFEDRDGLLRLLEASPGLLSFVLDFWRGLIDTRSEFMEISSGSNVVPLLESFTGCWEDAQFAFDPLLSGAFPNLSQLTITESGSSSRTVDTVSNALAESNCSTGAKLRYLAISMTVEVGQPNSSQTEEQDLLWTTWLTRIAASCPRLRGLVINAEDNRTAPENFRDETDGWKSALSQLQELVVLKLPHVVWQADVDDARMKGAAFRLATEQAIESLPKIRLLSTSRKLALVVNDALGTEIILERGKLLDQGQIIARTWSLYEDPEAKAVDHIVAELIPLRMNPGTEAWLEAPEGMWS
ncbi:hypothetical protein FRC00_006503 [Tulasnella sp. 408]|nr:hypothetical protein FRC00_006503 [Tulasnella sp. 408]